MKIYDNQVDSTDGLPHASMEAAVMHYALTKKPIEFVLHGATGFLFINGLSTILPSLLKTNLKEQDERYAQIWGTKAPILLLIGRETTKETKSVLTHLSDTINVQLSTVDIDDLEKIRDLYVRGLLAIRVYIKKRLHAKIFFFIDQQHIKDIFCGSSNLTSAGFLHNLELNAPVLANDDDKEIYHQWFLKLWEKGETDFNLLKAIDNFKESKYIYFPPRLFFLNIIKILNMEFLFYEIATSGKSILLEFQQFDHFSIVNKMRRYGGAVLATSVGLGKSYVALEIIRYSILEGKRVLLIVPSKMKATSHSTWNVYLRKLGFDVSGKVLVLGDGMLQQKNFDPTPYLNVDVIIIDEAHRFRNMSNKRNNLISLLSENALAKPGAEMLLMTATPINVHLSDLYRLIDIFYNFHKHLWQDKKINSTYKAYKLRVDQLEQKLRSEDIPENEIRNNINEVLKLQKDIEDELIQRSTRSTVQEHFRDDLRRISGKDKIIEPTVQAIEISYSEQYLLDIANDLPDFLESLHYEYTKFRILDDKSIVYEVDREALTFQRWTLFKRFESSIHALYKSLTRLCFKFRIYYDFFNGSTDLSDTDIDDKFKDILIARKTYFNSLDASLQASIQLRMKEDLDTTVDFLSEHFQATGIDPKTFTYPGDKKILTIEEIIQKNSTSPKDRKKFLIFTEYRDTLEYLKAKISSRNVVYAHGQGSGEYFDVDNNCFQDADLDEIIARFKDNRAMHIISTDVVSEGENLPEADAVINFDLPYNPVRIIQRCGRATRIDHPKNVEIINFTSSSDLSEVARKLNLRIHNLITFIGIDFQVWEGFEEDYRAKNRKDIETAGEFLVAWRSAISKSLPDIFIRGTVSKDEIDRVLLRKAIEHFSLEKADLPSKTPIKPIYTSLLSSVSKIYAFFKIRESIFHYGLPDNEILNADSRKFFRDQLDTVFDEIKKRKLSIFNSLQESAVIDKYYFNKLEKWKKQFPTLNGVIRTVMTRKLQSHPLIIGLLDAQKQPSLDQVSVTLQRILDEKPGTEVLSVSKAFSDSQESERILAFIQYLKGDDIDV